FSRENLNSMSKNELKNHLEHTLIIIEALSRQLQDWQRNGGLVTHLGPSEQRETFTQTDETHATQEKYHYNLYVKAVEKINSLQNSKQDEERLKKELQTAFESLKSLYDTSLSTFESAEKIYRMTQEAKKAMSQDVCRIREFLSKHTKLLQKISVKMQGCLQLREEMKSQLEEAIQTKEAVCAELENLITQNEQIILERKRLAAELASLMTESSQVRARNEHYVVELSSREARIKILEQAQTEERERLKQLLSDTQRQKHELQDQIYQLETCNEQIDDLQTQLSDYAKNRELLEEENYVCREQLIEIEKQLKSSLSLIWESNLQREEQKDTIQQLQKIKETLQEELDTTKAEARDMLLKMGKEISDSFGQITRMKEKLLDLSGSLKAALHEEDLAADNSVTRTPARFAIHTPTSSFVGSVLKAAQREAESDNEEEKSDGPMSEKSAFTKVQPTTPKVPDFEVSLPDILFELRGIIANLSITASQLLQNKTQEIHKLKKELSDLQDKQWKLNSQYTTEISNLKEEFINLKMEKENRCKILISKEQTLKQLQEIIQELEKKYLQLLQERRDTESLTCSFSLELYSEISQLKRSLQLLETEKSVLQEELAKSEETSRRDWLQNRLSLEKEVTKLRLMYLDAEDSKSEIISRTTRNTETLEVNLFRSEKEVKKLDDLLQQIRKAFLSVPEVVANCQELKEVMDFLGWWEEKHWKGASA
ncbi:sperm-associated antigen 5, partial [Microcaecilia unicolor]|uniref:Sperm-associated antigen 5-like n=1 Tax=Microcaecilia unicolor TaxID=1415580 RepID=A0A6P7WXD5_9AMPH